MPFLQLLSSGHRRTSQQLLVLILFVVSMFLGVAAANAAPGPNVPTLGNQDIFLGSPASFVFNFSNTGPDIGYGPFIELALDTSGPDGASLPPLDGYGTPSVTVAGLNLSPVASIPVTGINFVNPLTGETRPVPAGFGPNDTIFIYALPFGSFTSGQSTLTTITVPTSNRADIGTPLPIAITPGFRDDAASLAGPAFYGLTSTGSATPALYSLKKIYLGPEDETATGPNFPRRYRLEVDVATGQTVSNLVVTDDLATSMQITGRDATHMFASTAAGGLGSNIFTAANSGGTAVTTAPDGTLSYSFGSVTGVDGVDAVFEFEFYVPRDTSGGTQVLPQDATSGTDSVLATNTSNSSLDWTPIDSPRDPVQTAVPPAPSKSTLSHVLEEQSIAIQKIAAAIDPATGNPTTKIIPGTTLIRYTLNFQVSDYYALQNVQVNDVLADGLRLFTGTRGSVNAGLPTLAVNNAYLTGSPAGSRVNVPSADFGGGTIDYQRRYTLQSALPSGTTSDPTSFPGAGPTDPAFSAATVGSTINGSTLLNFDISAELIRRLGVSAGRLVGGEINDDGTGPDNDPYAGPNLGGTTGTIVFYAEVSEDFSDDFPSSDRSVDQGDLLLNTVNDPDTAQRDGIIADQIRPADINATTPTVIGKASDDSGAELEIGYGETSKTIERINGQTVPAQTFTNPPFSVQPGDRITYKLSYTLPIDSYEQLRLRDYPPLPVMPVGAAGQYSLETGAPSYNAYTVAIAPDDTFFSTNSFVGTAVNLTTAAALTGETYNIAGNGRFSFATAPTVDGVTVTAGMRILVKNQADTAQNGVYLATTATSWVRATDMDIESEVESSHLYAATLGSTNANIYYVQSNNQFSLFNNASARGQIIFEPFISTNTALNEILLNFGNFNNPSYSTVKLSVLLTLPVGSDPFSTDLLLTNQLRVNEASTNNGTTTVEDLRRYQLVRPNLAIQKGVVGANTTGFVLGGITFTAPNAAANYSGGPVDTATEAAAIGARNIGVTDALDAGDEVRYAIVAQNSGKGDAFDTILNDTIPIEYNRVAFNPATDLVLRRGDATQLTTSAAVNGFVRVATTTNLGGSFDAATGGGQFSNVPLGLIDGQKIIAGDRILVKDQATVSENGIYSVTAIDLNANTFTLTRSTDANTATALSGYRVAVAGGLSNADQHFQLSAVTTLNSDPVNAGAALGVRDYYTIYNSTTGNLQILLSDNYTAGNINDPTEDARSGSLSRGLRTDQTNGDTAIVNGSNTIIAMYDVVLQPTVEPNQVIPNTASILSYSNSQGGPDYTNPVNIPNASDPSDSAQVIVKLPLMAKTLVSTEVDTAGNNGTGGPGAQATIGEYITYKVTLTVPEGVSTATQIVDTLDAGLAFVDVTGVTASSGLSFPSGGLPTVSATPANTTINTFAGDAGRQIVFNFGTITNNTNVNNAAPETIEISYRAVVLNTLANQQTQNRNNAAQLSWQNNSGTVISVSAGQSSSLTGSTSDVPTPVTIVEPTLTNLKDVRNATQGETFPVAAGTPQQTRGDAGDTIEYRITIANPATGSTTAYDASLSDPLPTSYFPGGFTIISVGSTGTIRFNGTARAATAADFEITAGSLQFVAGLDVDIDPGATITILVQGAGFTGATGQFVNNIADLRWSSLDGTPGTRSTYNTNSTERTGADGEIGSGALNDYRDTDNAVIESPPIVRKTLEITSEAHTTGSNVAIGEIVRFRLVASVAEGTSANYQVQDFMPTGMSFLNDGTARWALVSDGGNVIASTAVGSVPSLGSPITTLNGGISGDQVNLNAITSSQIIGTFADANISTDANGAGTGDAAVYADDTDVFFRFGTLTNTDNDTDVEYVIVEFNALVRNQTSNQAGTNLDNSMTILADTNNDGNAGYIDVVNDTNGDGVGTGEATISATDADNNADVGPNTAAQSAPATVTVVEPNLTINKQVLATTGSVVTYRITLTNPTATNASTGYNLRVVDALAAANLTLLNPTSLTATLAGGATGATNNSSGNTVDFTIDVLPVGGSVTIDYSATVLTTPTGTTSIDNTANATDTSLPGLLGTGGDWAGTGISSTVPGTSGSATGERTGQDGVAGALNDYAVRDTERLGSLGDRVYYDANANGVQDVGEPGLVGVPVTVTWAGPDNDFATTGDNAVITVNTGTDGIWTVGGLPLGATQNYRVSVPTTFSGMDLTDVRDNGGAANTNPDGVGVGISAITLTGLDAATTNNRLQDFGYRGTASLGNRIYIDADGDGVQDANGLEPSLPGVATTLLWAGPDNNFTTTADNLTFTQNSTNAATNYLYSNLPAGDFRVTVSATGGSGGVPDNMTLTDALDNSLLNTDPNGLGAGIIQTNLTTGENEVTIDFGYRGNASLGDRVWLDQNGNGIQEASEVGLPGATIQVTWFGKDGAFGGGDDVVFNTTTGANGAYLLEGLPANALVGSTPNYRVEVTGGIIAGLDLTDSIDNGGAVSPVNPVDIQVSPVEGNLLNDRRDVDFGYDGLSSLAGTVFRDDNNNGVQDGSEPGIGGVTLTLTGVDVLGNPYIDPSTGQPYVAITDANGNYSFPTVVPGTYTITETQPGNYNDGIDTAGSLGGNAGNDVISGIPVGANQAGIAYNFGEIGTFISGIVFRDDNRDGVLDASETTGLGGVTIQLYDSTGTTLIATTTTAADGSYRFDNIAIGSYKVVETQPSDYASSPTGPFAPDTRTVSVPAAGLPNQNFGEILGSISGVVYIDANNDGLRDAADTGRIGNVPVTLTGMDINNNPVNLTVYTDASGAYRFDNIFPSDASGYTITEGSAAPYSDKAANPGTATGGSAGTASDANTITGIGLTAGSQGVNYDFGEIQPSSTFISGSVYRDDNKNGLRDTNEPAIPNTTITLYDAGADGIFGNADDGPAQTTTTDANGNYLFPNLVTGRNYQVVETQPAAYGNSPAGPTTLIAVNALPAAGSSNNNFGELLGSLAGLVYFDANNNGAFDSGENGIAGTTVSLSGTDINGNPVSLTTTTAADGSYRFDNLPAGSYTVTETQPAGYADGSETVGSSGGSTSVNDEISAITLSAGQNATSYNFGEVGVSVSGLIFYDTNRDGALDGSETVRIPNVSVQLIDKNGNVVATTTTAADGSYIFTNVPPGDYTIVEQQPTGYGDPLAGIYAPNSRPITVSNTNITDQNFGDTLSSLAGSVYVDSNNNGIREGTEAGISGVPVRLDWAGPDGIFGTADDVTGLDTTTTGINGGYLFTELLTGVYRVVEVSQPAPYTDGLETPGAAGGNTATNEQISAIPVAAGTDLTDYNFGEAPPANPFISGSVYIDSNNNGIRDPGEPGIPGVTVTLTGPGGGTITTDANGNYVFINLTAGSNYTIIETQPNEYGNGLENSSNTISIPSLPATGSSNNNFGEIPGSISGVVYFDKDSSGTLTAGDTRLPGVTLSLQDSNGNPVNNPLTGQPYVVVTGADGSYRFENLPAGNYRVVETQPSSYNDGAENPGAGNTSTVNDRIDVTLGAGASSIDNNFAELGAAISGTVWVDTDRDGTIDGAEAGRISGVTIKLYDKNGNLVGTTTTDINGSYSFPNLPPGDYTIVQEQPNAYGSSTSNTIAVSLTKTGLTDQNFGETLGSLSGMVYADVNRNGIHDAGEPGIPGVTVTLTGTDINGNSVNRTAITDVNGSYSFGDLLAGNYQLVEAQPAGYNDGQEQVGSAGGTIPTNDTIATVPLGAGVNASDYNFGEVSASISGTVWLDRDRDGSLDAGEPGIGTITIELRNNNGDLIATTTTNSDGSYSFIGLPGGDYQIIELQPNGYGSTTSNTISVTVPNDGLISNQNFGDSLGSINGAVYIDANADGVRDVGEVGISGVTIKLTGTDLNGNPVTRTVTTDNNGAYSFGDLLAGSYTVIESQPANYGDGLDAIGSAGGSLNNDTAGNIVITPGLDANGYNFGEGIPTAIVLAHFSASHEEAGVMLRWVTSVELNTWGFQVYRSTNAQRQDAVLVTPTLIVAQGRGQGGAQYEWLDTSAEAGVTYSYWLLETELDGQIHEYGPAQAALTTAGDSGYRVLLPLVMR